MTDRTKDQIEQAILEGALISPKATIMLLAIEIERELRKILASTGALQRFLTLKEPSLPNALKILKTVSGAKVPTELEDRIAEFWRFRNAVAHSNSDVPLLAFELGLSIVRILSGVPRPSYIVRRANIPLYADSNCRSLREGVRGVLIETFDADGVSQGSRIHPSTHDYAEGMSVGWEWDLPIAYRSDKGWDETWYKEETGKCTQAWSGSLEFVGRDINEV
jgi:hypothetical protein